MSNILDRLVCASANGERAPVDADDVSALLDLYERFPGEHPKADGPFHLNEYLANRAYGGPEEGGWWYDTGRFVACHGAFGTVDEATAARDAKANWLADRRQGLHPPDSVLCTGWPVLRIEPHAGRDFPATRPRYE